ncbi:hypothetical protein ACFODL_09650 [Phenylobacterium terrae]|uniref:Uncharacterized protein n=1 Tax=Phenylobacterium terrae TaxID=2665495 RepID=A0ABW4N5K7_9CAUL
MSEAVPIWVAAAGLALLALDRLMLRLEARGLVYWRRTRRKRSAGANVVAPLSGMFDPAANYLTEARDAQIVEEDGLGDGSLKRPPVERGPDGRPVIRRPARPPDC